MSSTSLPSAAGAGARAGPYALALRVLRAGIAVVFVVAGTCKLAGTDSMVALFAAIGVGQWLRYAVGVAEVCGGLSLLAPRIAGLSALFLVGMMIGAGFTEVVVEHRVPIASALTLAGLMLIAWERRPATRALLGRVLGAAGAGRRGG